MCVVKDEVLDFFYGRFSIWFTRFLLLLDDLSQPHIRIKDKNKKKEKAKMFVLIYTDCYFLLIGKGVQIFIWSKSHHVQQISEIISRFERKGFKLVGIKVIVPSKEFAQKHYHDLKERPFFNGLCEFLSSGPVIAMVSRNKNYCMLFATAFELG